MKTLNIVAAGLAATTVLAFDAMPSRASTFSAWEIAGVPFGDTLNLRKYPASTSQKQAAYPNGTVLQMTGRCTGGVNLFDISGKSEAEQRALVRYRWCEVWHDPKQNDGFVTGWAYGKYLQPN